MAQGITSAEAAATSLSNGCGRGTQKRERGGFVAPSSSLISPRKSDASLSAAQLRLPRPAAAATDPSSSVTEAAAAAAPPPPRDHLHVRPLGRRRPHPRIGGPDASRSGRSSCRATLRRRRWLIHNKLDKQNGWKIAAAARLGAKWNSGRGRHQVKHATLAGWDFLYAQGGACAW